MQQTRWWAYVRRLMDDRGWRPADLARATDIDQSVIGRWEKGSVPTPRHVRTVAKAFGRDVREAVLAAEHYTDEDLAIQSTAPVDPRTVDLTTVPHERLLGEVWTRVARRAITQDETNVARPAPRKETVVDTASAEGRQSMVVREAPLPEPTRREGVSA